MSASIYVEGDPVDVYVDGTYRGRGRVVEVSVSVVKVQFLDENDENERRTKAFEKPIDDTLSKNSENGHWVIQVRGSEIDDLP